MIPDVQKLSDLAKQDNKRYFVFPTTSVRDVGGYFDVWEVWSIDDTSPLAECFSMAVAVTICRALEEYAGGEATLQN